MYADRQHKTLFRLGEFDDAEFGALGFGRLGGRFAGVSLIDIDQFDALTRRLPHTVGERRGCAALSKAASWGKIASRTRGHSTNPG
jgi:hypothetical protein